MTEDQAEKFSAALSQLELFSAFQQGPLKEFLMSSGCSLQQISKGQVIYFQEEVCETIDVILNGQVSIQKIDEDGYILGIYTFSSGDHIGANLIFARENHYPMTVVADTDSKLLRIGRNTIIGMCRDNSTFMLKLIEAISERTLLLTAKLKSISNKTIRERLLTFLNYEKHLQGSNQIKLGMTKKKLAEKLGVQRSSLSRELQKMRREGLVSFDAKTITLL